MLSVNVANKGILMTPNFCPSGILTPCGPCSVQEAFRSCSDGKAFQRLAGVSRPCPQLELSPQTERQSLAQWGHQWLLLLPPGISAEVMTFCDSFLSTASIPRLKYSFLYLWRSSHGILHKCAFLQKHGAVFLTSEIPKGQKVNIIPV